MSNTDKRYVTDTIGIIRDGMTGKELKALVDKATVAPYIEANISVCRGYGYDSYERYEDDDEYELVAQRLETDEELTKRLSKEKKQKEAEKKRLEAKKAKRQTLDAHRDEKDRKLFEQLKKKFEPSGDFGPRPKSPFQG